MPNYRDCKKTLAQVWADEEVAMLLNSWKDKRIQEQLDRMPSQMLKVPLSSFITPDMHPTI